jgi:hypothetical protein
LRSERLPFAVVHFIAVVLPVGQEKTQCQHPSRTHKDTVDIGIDIDIDIDIAIVFSKARPPSGVESRLTCVD